MRALCTHFGADTVVVVGSQAIVVSWPDAPILLRSSAEFDAYPANASDWQSRHGGQEVSEEIFALFGEDSPFHHAHGFHIDGVDETTAKLPPDWRKRAFTHAVDCEGRIVHAVAPEAHDLAVSKLCRLDPKDKAFVAELYCSLPLEKQVLLDRLASLDVNAEVKARARGFVEALA